MSEVERETSKPTEGVSVWCGRRKCSKHRCLRIRHPCLSGCPQQCAPTCSASLRVGSSQRYRLSRSGVFEGRELRLLKRSFSQLPIPNTPHSLLGFSVEQDKMHFGMPVATAGAQRCPSVLYSKPSAAILGCPQG